MVADYIINGGDKQAFLSHFKNAVSKDFDPDTMLKNVGLANQTTMYKKETRAIGQLLQKAMITKYGPVDASSHYMEFDTICDATQVTLLLTLFIYFTHFLNFCFYFIFLTDIFPISLSLSPFLSSLID